jgi:hypothetical protein
VPTSRQAAKMEAAAQAMLARHRENDILPVEPALAEREARSERLTREAAQLREWLTEHFGDRKGAKGKIIKSNRTDNQSAKMATSKGVIQGTWLPSMTNTRSSSRRKPMAPAANRHS